MNSEIAIVIQTLNDIQSVEDEADLDMLNQAVSQLANRSDKEEGIDVLLSLFERFPEKDGYGIFWSILSLLETIPNYEAKLVESVQRQPALFSLLMINRLLNTEIEVVNGESLLNLLKGLASNPTFSIPIRKAAQGFIEHQEKRQADNLLL